jgi:L,D-transpeptidase ErfK/SrfK
MIKLKNLIRWLLACSLVAPGLAWALTYPMPTHGDIVGEVKVIRAEHEDTFVELARKYDVGYYELVDANPGVDPWIPGEGTRVVIPTQFILPQGIRDGIIINLAELRLYYFDKANNTVSTFPVGIGSEYWPTPTMTNEKITAKEKDPSWRVPPSIMREHENAGQPIQAVWGPGPDNPLGAYAMRTSHPGILIHGTDTPVGIGRRVTHGCVRMYPEDIEALFYKVPVGTPLQVVHIPVKAGWEDGKLYVELHKPLDGYPAQKVEVKPVIMEAVNAGPKSGTPVVDWDLVEKLSRHHPGIPQQIGEIK